MDRACFKAGGVFCRLLLGRTDDRLLRLDDDEDKPVRLSRELEARLEYLHNRGDLGVLRGVKDFLRGVDGPEDECK